MSGTTSSPLAVSFASQEELERELETTLSKGGLSAVLPTPPELRQSYAVALHHPSRDAELVVTATVVMVQAVADGFHVGFQLDNFGQVLVEQLRAFVVATREPTPAAAPARGAAEALRGLSLSDQLKVAREGGLSERVTLERLYGKTVWEALLHNPRITPPEVARIARMGTLPRPLVELIASNAGWLAQPIVRRALLSNPRLTGEWIHKVLSTMPVSELKLMRNQVAYPAAVRDAARRMLGG